MCVCVCVCFSHHNIIPFSEVKELESRLHELTRSSCDELKSLEEENKENTEAIQGDFINNLYVLL